MSASPYCVAKNGRHGYQPFRRSTAEARGLAIASPAATWDSAVEAAQALRRLAIIDRRSRAAARESAAATKRQARDARRWPLFGGGAR